MCKEVEHSECCVSLGYHQLLSQSKVVGERLLPDHLNGVSLPKGPRSLVTLLLPEDLKQVPVVHRI